MEERRGAQSLFDLIAVHARDRGAEPALLAPGCAPLGYAALRDEILRAVDALAAHGIGPGCRVAVSLPAGPGAVVALVAAMTQATCVPFDPLQDRGACSDLLRRLRVDALVAAEGANSPATAAAESLSIAVLRVVRRSGAPAGACDLRPDRPPPAVAAGMVRRGADVAVIFGTSGTTARPKLVPVSDAQILANAVVHPVDARDRFLLLAPLHTRSGFGLGIVVPLATGGSVVVPSGYDGARFVDWLDEFRPTWCSASPTVLTAMADALEARLPAAPCSLRFLRGSSDALPSAVAGRLESMLGVPVIQGYGTTEAGLVAQHPLPPRARRAGSAGLAMAELRIVGGDGGDLPSGVTGEILVRGPGVMDGYWDDPDASRIASADGWLRTGDLGHLDADGYLFLSGRLKELINRGGLKVSPSEVDARFLQHPAVRGAATFGVPHPSLGEDVFTAVVLRDGAVANARDLREFARSVLAPSQVPTSVLVVDALPLNPSGKLRRDALPALLHAALAGARMAPRDAEEALVATVFAEALGVPQVSANDHFFLSGGDSLRAARVIARIAAVAGVELDVAALFEAPTVALFAARVRASLRNGSAPGGGPTGRTPRLVGT